MFSSHFCYYPAQLSLDQQKAHSSGPSKVSLSYGTFHGLTLDGFTKYRGVPIASACFLFTGYTHLRLSPDEYAHSCMMTALSFRFSCTFSVAVSKEEAAAQTTFRPWPSSWPPDPSRLIVAAPNHRVSGGYINDLLLILSPSIYLPKDSPSNGFKSASAFGGKLSRVAIGGLSAGSISAASILLSNKQNSKALIRGTFLMSVMEGNCDDDSEGSSFLTLNITTGAEFLDYALHSKQSGRLYPDDPTHGAPFDIGGRANLRSRESPPFKTTITYPPSFFLQYVSSKLNHGLTKKSNSINTLDPNLPAETTFGATNLSFWFGCIVPRSGRMISSGEAEPSLRSRLRRDEGRVGSDMPGPGCTILSLLMLSDSDDVDTTRRTMSVVEAIPVLDELYLDDPS
ncbi:hypothetical protein C8R46DRAFT_1208863 [Mycena filopes]|nr:hypothetical protein C8R46DRAFT_1208863 [Mycena filopes]